jgi:uncharacterized protein YjiS (DUF1127 family)
MTGSVPSIALPAVSYSGHPTADVASKTAALRRHGKRKPVVAMVWSAVWSAWGRLQFVNCVWRERRLLASLDDRALKDIGLNRCDVERETGRSPLDLPHQRPRLP